MADKKEEKPAEAPKEEKKEGEAGAAAAGAPAGGEAAAGAAALMEQGFVHKKIINTKKDFAKMYLNSDREKKFLEQMRRWKVHIKEIWITPLEEMFDPFIQFTIGGDFGVEVFINTKKNKKIKKVNGERGFSDKTEVLRDCKINERVKFEKEIDTEIRDTIVSLMKQNILVEVWEWEQWSLNNLDGFYLFDIFEIIQGNICQTCIIEKSYDDKIKKPFAKVEFKIIFQEIWDFVLSFEDWAATNVNSLFPDEKTEDINAGIEFKIGEDKQSIENLDFKKGSNPEWSKFTDEIQFRGTLNDLETQHLTITLENVKQINISLGLSKPNTVTDLKGVTTDGLIKTFIVKAKDKDAKKNDDDDLETLVRGKINVNSMPKYKQQGLDTIIVEGEIYMIMRIGKISNFNTPNFVKLPVCVYITVEWNGKTYETRKLLIQTEKKFDQDLNYLFGLKKEITEETMEVRRTHLISNLKSKNDVIVKLWLEDAYRCQDFLGQFEFQLIDIFEKGVNDSREFKRDDQVIPYYTRVLRDKSQFESSYTKQENYILDYEAWFYPSSFTNAVELTREDIARKERGNPINDRVEEIIGEWEQHIRNKTEDLRNSFENFKERYFFFTSESNEAMKFEGSKLKAFYVIDQVGQKRFINSYLSKLTIKGFNFELKETDPKKILDDKELLPKIKLPINTPHSLLHYVKCIRYTSHANDDYLMSPDCFMLNRKGSKYEHAIFLACLMMNMYSNLFTLPDSDDEEEGLTPAGDKPEDAKTDKYTKLDEIKEVDNKLEIDEDKKDDKKEDDKDKTQDISNRSVDPLVKIEDDKKAEVKVEIANAPTSVTQKKKKPKKVKQKGVGFDTVISP